MKKNRIFAVCDVEEAYARSFMEFLNQKRTIPFEIQAFTNTDTLCAYAEKQEIEILLISESMMESRIKDLHIGHIMILTEGSGQRIKNVGKEKAYPSIYKYQSSEDVVREVMSYYDVEYAQNGINTVSKRQMEIVGIYSPVGHALKTTFALTLGQLLAKDRAVLYLNLEEYSGFEELFSRSYERTLSDLIYYMNQDAVGLIFKMNAMIQSLNNLDYVPPAFSPADIRCTGYEQWLYLINEIRTKSSYETLIIDFGDGADELFSLLELCDIVFTPVHRDRISSAKINQFENLLKIWDYKKVMEKMRKIQIPYHNCDSAKGDFFTRLLWSELGDFARELIRRESL